MFVTDYYKTLEIEGNAAADTIKAAHRRLSKRFHPDVSGADELFADRFKDVQEAYGVLSDPKKRRQYDRIYRRYAGKGTGAGNLIYVPDSAAGKTVWPWHPDYKEPQPVKPLNRRSGLLLALAIFVALAGSCLLLFWGTGTDSSVTATDETPLAMPPPERTVLKQKAPAPAIAAAPLLMDTSTFFTPLIDTLPVSIGSVAAAYSKTSGRPESPPASTAPAKPLPYLTDDDEDAIPRVLVDFTSWKPKGPRPVSLPLPEPPAAIAVPAPAPAVPVASGLVPRTDTDQSDLMVRRVTQVQYGYVTIMVKRTFHFPAGKPDEDITVHYVSGIRVYKPADIQNRDELLGRAIQECMRHENQFSHMAGEIKITYVIIRRDIRLFSDNVTALRALGNEGRVTAL